MCTRNLLQVKKLVWWTDVGSPPVNQPWCRGSLAQDDEDWAAVCRQGIVEGRAATCEGTAEGREGETSREETPIFVSVSLE